METTAEIIHQIETLLERLKISVGMKPSQKADKSTAIEKTKTFSGLSGEIYNLIQEGFFSKPKVIAEIQAKLRLEGINKPTTTLMKPLLVLIKKKALGRSKPEDGKGAFTYHERKNNL